MHDLNDLAIFVRLSERLNFEAAARDLQLSPSTVSRRVAALEARLGVPLVLRTTRSVRLTPAGADYAERCRAMVAAADEADVVARSHLDGLQGVLKVNAPILFGRLVLAPIVADFAACHPAVRIHLSLGNARVDLNAEGIDLVIRTGVLPDSGLRARRLATASFVVAASPACIARFGMPTTIDAFASLPCVALDRDGDHRWWTGADARPVAVRAIFVADDIEILRDAAIRGLGFALLPRFAATPALDDGRLVAVPLDAQFEPAPVWLVFPSHKVPNRCASALADAVVAALATDPAWADATNARRPSRGG